MPIQIGGGINIGQGITVGTGSVSAAGPNGSILFNSSPAQYLSIPNNTAFTQNQPFTIECWFRPTSYTGGYVWAMLQHNFYTVTYRNSGKFVIDVSYVGFPPVAYSTNNRTYPINNWYHVALTWDGTNGYLYINGAWEWYYRAATATVADGNPFLIGQYQGQGQPTPLGYISNFRVVKGVAVYSGTDNLAPNFTVPTSPLTLTQSSSTNISAITTGQTQLLLNTTNDANFLKDSSTNNFTVTNNGSVTSSALNPF